MNYDSLEYKIITPVIRSSTALIINLIIGSKIKNILVYFYFLSFKDVCIQKND